MANTPTRTQGVVLRRCEAGHATPSRPSHIHYFTASLDIASFDIASLDIASFFIASFD